MQRTPPDTENHHHRSPAAPFEHRLPGSSASDRPAADLWGPRSSSALGAHQDAGSAAEAVAHPPGTASDCQNNLTRDAEVKALSGSEPTRTQAHHEEPN